MDEAQKQAEETAQEIDAEHKERLDSVPYFSSCAISSPARRSSIVIIPEIKCKVVDEKQVEYQGQKYSSLKLPVCS